MEDVRDRAPGGAEAPQADDEQALARLPRLVARLLGTPVAGVSYAFDGELRVLGVVGGQARDWPADVTLCAEVLRTGDRLVVPDAPKDPAWREHPAVRDYGLRAYCGVPVRDEAGRVVGAICAVDGRVREWSEEDQALLAELALSAATELRLRAAIEELERERRHAQALARVVATTRDPVVSVDRGGLITGWNRGAELLYGWRADEMLCQPIDRLKVPDLPDPGEGALARLLAGEQFQIAARPRRRRDGATVLVDVDLTPLCDDRGEIIGAMSIGRDVTERMALEDRLNQSERRHRALIASLPQTMVCLYDPELHCTLLEGPLVAELGVEVTGYLGRTIEEFLSPVQATRLASVLRRALGGEEVRLEYPSEDGNHYEVDVVPYREDDGAVAGVFTVWRDVTERRGRERERRRLATIVEQSGDAILVKDLSGTILEWNAAAERMYGYSAAEAVGRPVAMLVPPDRMGEDQRLIERVRAGEPVSALHTRRRRHDGTIIDVSVTVSPVHDEHGELVAAAAIARDITEQQDMRRELEAAGEQLRVTVEHAPIGIALVGLGETDRGRLLSANAAFGQLLGDPEPVTSGRALTAVVHPDDLPALHRDLALLASSPEARIELEVRCLHPDGRIGWLLLAGAALPGDGGSPRAVMHAVDIGERKRAESQLQYLADHDALTGLYNRRRLESELDRAVAHAKRYREEASLLVIDLDGFKYVNDTMGHTRGDELVTRVAELLHSALRESDVVARLGGDEFAVIATHTGPRQGRVVAEKVLETLRRQAVVLSENRHARVTASIGLTTFSGDSQVSAEELLVEADIAMYEAKEAGKDQVAVYERPADHRQRLSLRHSWLERLRSAVDEERFELAAQPIRAICGEPGERYELLLRLPSASGELITPGTFLYNAERFGLIGQIDRWVFGQALGLLSAHHQAGHDLSLSINMSGKTLVEPDLLRDLEAMIEACPIPPDKLVVEVTETAAIVNIETARRVARTLRSLGCRFALDDFGAGFASFYYLKHLEFDYLKIDGEFVKTLAVNRTDELVVKSVVDIARGLGAWTVAEFVGDDATLARLAALGVDYGQGYHLGRPAPLPELLPAAR